MPYPVVFGKALSFSLPPTAEGVSLEAELDGAQMVFPLGPDLYLSWATCAVRTGSAAGKSTVYQCVLKPGYRVTESLFAAQVAFRRLYRNMS